MGGFIIGTYRVLVYILFFVLLLAGPIFGGVMGGQAAGEAGAVGGAIAGLVVGFLYAVIITGGMVLFLDMRRLLASIDEKLTGVKITKE